MSGPVPPGQELVLLLGEPRARVRQLLGRLSLCRQGRPSTDRKGLNCARGRNVGACHLLLVVELEREAAAAHEILKGKRAGL